MDNLGSHSNYWSEDWVTGRSQHTLKLNPKNSRKFKSKQQQKSRHSLVIYLTIVISISLASQYNYYTWEHPYLREFHKF